MYPNQRDRQARATETPEYRKARLARRREHYREGRAEVRKQLNNGMKLGFADREELTEAQARSQKKQLNSVKLHVGSGADTGGGLRGL